MEDYPSLTFSFTIGLPTLGLCCFRKIIHLESPPLSGYYWKTPRFHTFLLSLLCSKLPLSNSICTFTSNPIVKHSFRILTQFRQSFSLKDLPNCTPITKKQQFMPSIIDGAFHEWAKRGVVTIENLFIDNTFASFDQVKLKFNIPNSHLFRFLQLRSLISASFTPYFPSLPPDTLLNAILKLNSGSKGIIGNIYSLLNTYNSEP